MSEIRSGNETNLSTERSFGDSCLNAFLQELGDDMTGACMVPVNLPQREIINIVKRAERVNGWVGFFDSFKDRFARYYKNEDNKVFYTNGGELKIKDTNTEYVGYYHVHPSKGILMEGRVHVDTPHSILVLIEEGDILTKIKISEEGEVGTSRRRNIPRGLY